jgi:hypothetical protein
LLTRTQGLEETYTYVDIKFLPEVVDTIKRDLTPKLSKHGHDALVCVSC